MSDQEKRKYPRVCCNVEVEFSLVEETATHITSTKDISKGGIRIITLEKLEPGQCLNLKFFLPDTQEVIFAIGKVAWTEPFLVGNSTNSTAYDAGVEFLDQDSQAIEKLCLFTLKPVQ